jgi:hypothetical protein
MSGTLATSNGGAVASKTVGGITVPNGGRSLVAPGGTGAVGVVAISIARMSVLLDQANKALLLLDDVGRDLHREATVTDEMVQYLTASFGERISIDEIRVIAGMLTQISEGSIGLVAQALDSVRQALVSNIQVQRAQEGVHATGADGGYIDSQRRVG